MIAKMNDAISHRGPDDRGTWNNQQRSVYLGHQRLSILDLSENGHQPMTSPAGNAIVYNGEVYNFRSLRSETGRRRFKSETDTEVLLYLYESFGSKMLDKLNGMFAFAIWDSSKKELLLARDRIGIKPIYYIERNGVFAFSSEIKALLTLPWVTPELDEEACYDFLTYSQLHPPQTMFKNINKFHPGYRMVVGRKGVHSYEPFWEVQYEHYNSSGKDELQRVIYEELESSVQRRMVSDVPVGAFLSGGVDSSGIVSLMSRFTSQSVKTYSIGFENAGDYNELQFARKIAKQFNTDHYEMIIRPRDVVDFLPRIVDIFDEPLVDATAIPIYFLSQMAHDNGSKVVLTGDGPDELFAGYRNWKRYIKLYPYFNLWSTTPIFLQKMTANIYGSFDKNSPVYEMLSRAANRQDFFWGAANGFKESTKSDLLNRAYTKRLKKPDSYQRMVGLKDLYNSISKNGRAYTEIDWLCFVGLKDIIPNVYLARSDRLAMANSVETRVPYLDHNFVNLALSIDGRWKIQGDEPKYIFKKSLETILDHETLYRKKQGFCVPMREWASDLLVEYIQANLSHFCDHTGLFNEAALELQVNQLKHGDTSNTNRVWTLYFLMAWFRKWLM